MKIIIDKLKKRLFELFKDEEYKKIYEIVDQNYQNNKEMLE